MGASYTIESMQASDVDEANEMRMQSWLETYPNDEADVTLEWIESQHDRQLSAAARQRRLDRFLHDTKNGKMAAWIARDEFGKIVGSTTPFIDQNGMQHVGSIYVLEQWHGTGIGGEFMQKIIEWFDNMKPIELEVASYNERAKAFYRKWGFEEIPNSQRLHREKMPVIKMIRKGD